MPRDATPGLTLGSYRLEARIGVGGMGEVWRAVNVTSASVRAIKVIKPEFAASEEFKQRFLREGKSLDLLHHPNIVRGYDVGEHDGILFMAMELLDGQSADAWLEAKQTAGTLPTVQEACNVLCQVLEGVASAHSHDIVHRDLKPPNFFLTTSGVVKVLDFGIARHGDAHTRVTRTNAGMPGSPGYFAPEFGKGQPASPASDVYALGVSLFELLAGRWPFLAGGGTSEMATLSLLMQHATEPMPDVRTLRTDVPREVAEVLLAAGAKRPEERPTADAFRDALLPFAGSVPRPGRGTRSSSNVTPVRNTPGNATPRPPAPGTSFGIVGMGEKPSATPAKGPLSTALAIKGMNGPAGTPTPVVPPVAPPTPVAAPTPVATPRPTTAKPARQPGGRRNLAIGILVFVVAVVLGVLGVLATTGGTTTETKTPPSEAVPVPEGMALIPAGKYPIGDDHAGFSSPRHEVELSAFVIDRTEVSIGEARRFVEVNPTVAWPKLPPPALDQKPMNNVTVEQAQAYCAWHVKGGALPSEQQWEAAARGTAGRRYPWGDTDAPDCVHQNQGADGISEAVDALPCGATPEGVRNLLGNVAEWTNSVLTPYPGNATPVPEVLREPGAYVVRGGSFDENGGEVSVTSRQVRKSGNVELNADVGFRCVALWP